MVKFTEVDLEMAFNAGRRFEGGEPEKDDKVFEYWFDDYDEDESENEK